MIDFDDDGLQRLLAADDGAPVVMLNLLKFTADGGALKYAEYAAQFEATGINARYGVELVYAGQGSTALVSEGGHTWDLVLLVRYPSRQHFVDMVRDPAYRRFEHLRTEALDEAVLQATTDLFPGGPQTQP